MPRVAVIAHQRKLEPAVRRAFDDALFLAGVDRTWFDVPKAKKAKAAAAHALDDGFDVVVACGGDGTVRAASEAVVGTDAALAVLPTGTANLFARGFGLPAKAEDVAALIVSGARRVVDSGVCNDQTFNVMAGAGFDARMIADADSDKERLGMLAYVRAGFRHAGGTERFDAQVTIDGRPVFAGPAACVLVGNIGTLTGGIAAFPDASPTDGRLDVGILTAAGWRQWASVAVDVLRHRSGASPHAVVCQGREIEVSLDGPHRYELDGGGKGRADRMSFSVRPAALTLCAPAS